MLNKEIPEGFTKVSINDLPENDEPLTVEVVTASGEVVDILKMSDTDIKLSDIAHSLSNQCRYNGNTQKFYSVAEHSVLLARYALSHHKDEMVAKPLARNLLMHDATEAYLGDVVTSIKDMMYEYQVFEEYVAEKIRFKYALQQDFLILAQLIKQYDKNILINEAKQCFNNQKIVDYMLNLAVTDKDMFELKGVEVKFMTPEQAKEAFLQLAKELEIND
jgi:5'-deoxynucleotidase YfbR-like HD superfamily hydrolase